MILTPEQWRDKASKELDLRRVEIALLHDYYEGCHPLPTAPDKTNEAYRRLAQISQANMTALVVNTLGDALRVEGIQFSGADALDVWEKHWLRNHLQADQRLIHREALISKRSFVLVWPDADGGIPSITPEDPAECIVFYQPGSTRIRVAAFKSFTDPDSNITYATLILPNVVYRWQKAKGSGTWTNWDGDDGLGSIVENQFGDEIPMVEFRSRPDICGDPHGEIDQGVIGIQDRINKGIFDRVVNGESHAAPQRYTIGLEAQLDADGNEVNPLKPGKGRVWRLDGALEGEQPVQIGQLPAADPTGLLKATQADIEMMATTTSTPIYMLSSNAENVAATTITAQEVGRNNKIDEDHDSFGESWCEVTRLSLIAVKDPRANDLTMQVDWKPAKTQTSAELADALVKLDAIGVPHEVLWRVWGFTPTEVAEIKKLQPPPPPELPPPGKLPTKPPNAPIDAAAQIEETATQDKGPVV